MVALIAMLFAVVFLEWPLFGEKPDFPLRTFTTSYSRAVALSPDGQRVVLNTKKGSFEIRDIESGELLWNYYLPSETKQAGHDSFYIAFSPDGTKLLIGSNDYQVNGARIHLVDIANKEILFLSEIFSEAVNSVSFSPDGKHLLGAGVDTVVVWDSTTGAVVQQIKGAQRELGKEHFNDVCFTPDGNGIFMRLSIPSYLVGTTGPLSWSYSQAVLWEVSSGKQVVAFDLKKKYAVTCSAISPDGSQVVTAGSDGPGRMHLWDATQAPSDSNGQKDADICQKPIREYSTSWDHGFFYDVAFSPDGKYFATAETDWDKIPRVNTISDWDHRKDEIITSINLKFGLQLPRPLVDRDVIHEHNDKVTGNLVRLWDVETGEVAKTIRLPNRRAHNIIKVLFSAKGDRLLTSSPNGTIRIWDISDIAE